MSRILYIQYTNPAGYPPLEHSSRILADAGWQVLFLGTGALGANDLQFPPHPRIRVKQLPFCPAGLRQKFHYISFCLWVLGWAIRWRPKWVYASDLLACPPALSLGMLLRRHLIYHEHDSPNTESRSAFLRFCLAARRRCARSARCCILPNQNRARQFSAETRPASPALVVWNCPSRTEVVPSPRRENGHGLRLLYHGSIVPERLPLTVIEALAKLPDNVILRIIGYETVGSSGYLGALRLTALRLGIANRIDLIGTLQRRAEILEVCRDSDVGLALLPPAAHDRNIKAMTGASNKPFDYLACGVPVLVSDLPDWHDMFVGQGFGLGCDPSDPASIATAIQRYYDAPAEMRAMGERGRQRVMAVAM